MPDTKARTHRKKKSAARPDQTVEDATIMPDVSMQEQGQSDEVGQVVKRDEAARPAQEEEIGQVVQRDDPQGR